MGFQGSIEEEILYMYEADAVKVLDKAGKTHYVVERDGYPTTESVSPYDIALTIKDGKVIKTV